MKHIEKDKNNLITGNRKLEERRESAKKNRKDQREK